MSLRNRIGPPWALALSGILAVFALCLRASTPFLLLLDEVGLGRWFAAMFLIGVAAGSALSLTRPLSEGSPRPFALAALVAGTIGTTGTTCALGVETLPHAVCALGAGALVGLALAVLLFLWCRALRTLDHRDALPQSAATLLLASLWWYAASLIGDATLFCLALTALLWLGGAPLLRAGRPLNGDDAAPGSATLDSATPRPTASEGAAGKPFRLRSLLAAAWSSWAGILFNFFTIGLTFWPQAAGLGEGAPSPKPLAYLLVLACVAWFSHRQRAGEPHDGLFLRAALPIAAAIMLASPFVDHVLPLSGSLVFGVLSYAGIALCNVAGLRLLLSVTGTTIPSNSTLAPRLFAVFCCSCALAVGAGMAVFSVLGGEAQIVSLCLLAAYLMAMVLAEVRAAARPAPAAAPSLDELCARLSARFGLSARESEILPYLARGRGAKAIAGKLHISPETVRTHCKRIYEKMGVHTREELLDLIEEAE